MGILYFFEKLRCPVLDVFFSLVTRCGEEMLLIAFALLFFWCINKREGYYLLSVGLLGLLANQMLKILGRVPRPWVKDPDFTIVESAREQASGYSFPSGHTQSAVGLFGSIARWNRGRALRIGCIALALLVAISRMYLGVHTLWDVGVSLLLASAFVLLLHPLFVKMTENPKRIYLFFGIVLSVAVACLLFVFLYRFPADTDPDNLISARKNLCRLVGFALAANVVYFLDERYIRFSTEASLLAQCLKYIVGAAVIVGGAFGGLNPLLKLICGSSPYLRNGILYFCLVLGAGVWPLTFPFFERLADKMKKK